MKHDTFILIICCLIVLFFNMCIIGLFTLLYAVIADVWLSLLLTVTLSVLAVPLLFKTIDKLL